MVSKRERIAAAIIVIESLSKKQKKDRSVWERKWLQRRKLCGAYDALSRELRMEDPSQLRNFIRMSAEDFEELSSWIAPIVQKKDTNMCEAISVGERLMLTLRFLATGDSYTSLSYLFRIAANTICGIVPDVCQALSDVLQAKGYLKASNSIEDWDMISNGFMENWNFPRCVGAIDGKHVMIQAPPNSGSEYYNYKGFHSIVLLAVVDFDYKFLLVDIGCNGRHNDNSIFLRSEIAPYLEKQLLNMPTQKLPGGSTPVPYVILGDSAFGLHPYLMKPFPHATEMNNMLHRVFNYRLSRARRTVENAFGIAASVFRVLRKPIMLKPNNADRVIFAITCLHNYLRTKKTTKSLYTPFGSLDHETSDGQILPGTWRQEGMPTNSLLSLNINGPKNVSVNAKDVRQEFMNYFVSEDGELPWQYNRCLLNLETRSSNLAK